MKPAILMSTAMGLLAAAPVLAQSIVDQLISEYQARGFDFIEVQQGPSQIKVEATINGQTTEVIYDAATGRILEIETEIADADDRNRTGVEIRQRARDFFDGRSDDDDHGHDGSGDDDDRDGAGHDEVDDRPEGSDDRRDDDNQGRADDHDEDHDDDDDDDDEDEDGDD